MLCSVVQYSAMDPETVILLNFLIINCIVLHTIRYTVPAHYRHGDEQVQFICALLGLFFLLHIHIETHTCIAPR